MRGHARKGQQGEGNMKIGNSSSPHEHFQASVHQTFVRNDQTMRTYLMPQRVSKNNTVKSYTAYVRKKKLLV